MPLYWGRELAKEKVWGDEADNFRRLPAYIERLRIADPESCVLLKKHPTTKRFQAIFIVLGSLINAIQYLRQFFAFDGTHIRTKYNLTLLIAVGIDGEGHVLPLAWAIVPKENDLWWSWFINLFKQAFGELLYNEQVVTISDRSKGLLNAMDNVFPTTPHSMCCQHLAENIHKEFGPVARKLFWPIAKARGSEAFLTAVRKLKEFKPAAEQYLDNIGYYNFAFYTFPCAQYGHNTLNIVKSINLSWSAIRNLPPFQMLEKVYNWSMIEFYKRARVKVDEGNLCLTNRAFRAYQFQIKNAQSYIVLPSSDTEFLVETPRGHSHQVILPKLPNILDQGNFVCGECSCQLYQEYQSPCSHALAAISFLGKPPLSYFHWSDY